MQKYILSFFMLVLSQQIYSQELSFSVVVDPAITWMKTNQRNEIRREGSNFGLNVGLVMDKFFTDKYALSTGLTILNTGGNLNYKDSINFDLGAAGDTLPGGSTVTYKLQYLTIPVSLKLHSTEIGYTTMFAHLGLNNHINLRAIADVESQNVSSEDIRNEINLFMMSYFIGGGASFSFGGDFAILAGVYLTGAIWDVTANTAYRAYINMVSLRLGVKF
jgi:hypothetical protein